MEPIELSNSGEPGGEAGVSVPFLIASVCSMLCFTFLIVLVVGRFRPYQQVWPLIPRFNLILYPLQSPDEIALSSHARHGMIDMSNVRTVKLRAPGLYYKEFWWRDGTCLWVLHLHLAYLIAATSVPVLVLGLFLNRRRRQRI